MELVLFRLLAVIYGYIIYMEYTVYRLENIVTKKNYIGMTSMKPQIRWRSGYKGKMKEAIDAFPLDLCWKKHIEFQTPNKNQALELEAELMKWYDSVDNGYNISAYDSNHYKHSEEHRKKISESMKGKIYGEVRLKPVLQFSKDGEFIAEYPSVREACRQTGCHNQSICKCCKGKRKSCGGYVWKYKEGV